MIETLTVENGSAPSPITSRYRFQLDNHLSTVAVETDANGAVISYEEYHPYGTSAYRAMKSGVEVSAKRYRYTGKEKDEETKLYLMGARYYAAWLARWTAADPAGTVDGTNLYAYVRGSPVGLVDPSGTQSVEEFTKTGVYLHGSADEFARSEYAAKNFTTSEEAHAFYQQALHVRELEAGDASSTAKRGLARESGEAELEDAPVSEAHPQSEQSTASTGTKIAAVGISSSAGRALYSGVAHHYFGTRPTNLSAARKVSVHGWG
jgi:RHS repeat-associated protein